MMEILSARMINAAIAYGTISANERDLYKYAYSMLLATILSWVSMIIIGLVSNCLFGMIAFLFTFFPLRIYAGGFHARGYRSCYWLSITSIFIMVFLSKAITAPLSYVLFVIIGLVASIIIFCISPIADPNKPLEDSEVKKYCEKTRLIVSIEMLTVIIMIQVPTMQQIAFFMCAALIMEAILLLIPCSKRLDIE